MFIIETYFILPVLLNSITADTIDINWFSILSPVADPELGFGADVKKSVQ